MLLYFFFPRFNYTKLRLLFYGGMQLGLPQEHNLKVFENTVLTGIVRRKAVAYPGGGGVWGVQTPPPRNSEDTGGDLDRTSKKNRRLDFLL